ncbi:MAG: hypothetical protein HZB23_15495 [Deltaproteobacteria bacterium]|nr:hypothetical protein [Deltaproteobacteria bacterium]
MKVWIKSFEVNMEIKQNGLELEVRSPNGKEQLGDCYVTMTGLTWCLGKITRANGVELKWSELATLLSSVEARKAALKAAKAVLNGTKPD